LKWLIHFHSPLGSGGKRYAQTLDNSVMLAFEFLELQTQYQILIFRRHPLLSLASTPLLQMIQDEFLCFAQTAAKESLYNVDI